MPLFCTFLCGRLRQVHCTILRVQMSRSKLLIWPYVNTASSSDGQRSVLQTSHLFVCLFDLILYVPVKNLSVMSGRVFVVEPVLSKDKRPI